MQSGYAPIPQNSPGATSSEWSPQSPLLSPSSPAPTSPDPSHTSFEIPLEDEKYSLSPPSKPKRRLRKTLIIVVLLGSLAILTGVGVGAYKEDPRVVNIISDAKKVGGDASEWMKGQTNAWLGMDDLEEVAEANEVEEESQEQEQEQEQPIGSGEEEGVQVEKGDDGPMPFEEDVISNTTSEPTPTAEATSFATIVRPASTSSTTEPQETTILVAPIEKVECSSSIKKQRSDPASWIVQKIDNKHFTISLLSSISVPADSLPCYSSAIFSVRLLSPSSSIVQPLPYATLSSPDSGTYSIEVPPNAELNIPEGEYEVEVRLEFGGLGGLREGMVCGEGVERCTTEMLEETGRVDEGFVGGRIGWDGESGTSMEAPEQLSSDLPLCTSLSPLSGYWSSLSFHPSSCSLFVPSLPLPTSFSSSSIIWLHLVGDSNSRNLFKSLRDSFGSGPSGQNFVRDSPKKNGTVSMVAWRARGGQFVDGEKDPEVVVSWQWWTQEAEAFEENAEELKEWTEKDLTLGEYLERSGMGNSLKDEWSRDVAETRPTRMYVSLGSHSEELTALGMERSLEVLLGPSGLEALLPSTYAPITATADKEGEEGEGERTPLRILTTTLVKTPNIPLDRFPHQDLLRNNPIIQSRNSLLRNRKELQGIIIDAEGLTRGLTEGEQEELWMKKKGTDAVHFRDEVYAEWTRLIWTDLATAGRIEA